MTARALVLGAQSVGPTTLAGPLRARDTELMASGLRSMGASVSTVDDGRWVVRPRPLTGPARIEVGSAGTVTRFLPPLAALATGPVTFAGDPRTRQRPIGPLVQALRSLGVRVDASPVDGLPMVVHGEGRVPGGQVAMDASLSSQLVSGLMLAAPDFDHGLVVRHTGAPVPSAPYLRMTVQMLRAAGAAVDDTVPNVWHVAHGRLTGRAWQIEPDLSTAAPFLAAALVTGSSVTVPGWPRSTTQASDRIRDILTRMGGNCVLTEAGLTVTGTGVIHGVELDLHDDGELTPVVAALATLADSPTRIFGIAHIRTHETDRIATLAYELGALGADLVEESGGLMIRPRPLKGGIFETYDDHRMAYAGAIIGLAVPGIVLSDVACTSKTLPDFPALWSQLVPKGME